jgi:anti-sigma factor RsiW
MPHIGEELHELVDNRSSAERRAEIEAHLAACAQCRAELETLQAMKRLLRERANALAVPDDLADHVTRALDREDGARTAWYHMRPVRFAAAAIIVIAVGALLTVSWRPPPAHMRRAAEDFRAYARGTLTVERATADVQELERFFVSRGVPFETRVFDLGMMQYALVGGTVITVDDQLTPLIAYRGSDGTRLICRMYLGRIPAADARATVREHNGIIFYVYQAGGLTMVFWQEGRVVCLLVGDGAAESVVQLAFAKAIRVDP